MLRETFRRIRYWLSGGERASSLDEEMRLHVALRAEKLRNAGLPPGEAAREAQRRFGNNLLLREESRAMWSNNWLDDLASDVRIACRGLLRRPGFALSAILTLAIQIGANTAVFCVVNSVLLRPLPYPDPDRLISVSMKAPGAHGRTTATGDLLLSPSLYITLAEQNQVLLSIGVWSAGAADVTGFNEPEKVRTVALSDGTLQALGVKPLLGRGLVAYDHDPTGPATVVLTHGFWQRRFGADRDVIGRSVLVDSRPREIVGVMPAGFRVVDTDADLILPLRFHRGQLRHSGFGLQGVARLKPGVDLAAAKPDLARLIPLWIRSWPALPGVDPKAYEAWQMSPSLRPLKQAVVGDIGEVLWPVMSMMALVMLIVAANVAGLFLARMQARDPELATRVALGAGAGRIIREILTETTLLALAGGVLGLAAASAVVRYLAAAGPVGLPRLGEISVGFGTACFAMALSLIGASLTGLIPILKHRRSLSNPPTQSGNRSVGPNRGGSRVRDTLVIVQVTLAIVLLVGAGLMIRTFRALHQVDLGFREAARLQTAQISVPGKPDAVIGAESNIVEAIRSIPGVESAAFISEVPLDGGGRGWDAICLEGQRLSGTEIPPVRTLKSISPGLFHTMGTSLVAGRDFT